MTRLVTDASWIACLLKDVSIVSFMLVFVCWQYELVAELFHEDGDAAPIAVSSDKAKRGGAVVRASKVAQKSTQQQRQHKKTVGSQVSSLFFSQSVKI